MADVHHFPTAIPERSDSSDKNAFDASVFLAVDDKTRHWLYFRAQPRTDAERAASIHKTDAGGASVSRTVRIRDGRPLRASLTLDDASFELIDVPTSLKTEEFYELGRTAELRARYYAEVEAIVKAKLQCDKVVFLHHVLRNAQKHNSDNHSDVQGYASGGPHTDSSAVSADELALQTLKAEQGAAEGDAPHGRYKRYAYLNLWRNISASPIENDALCVLDERTTVKPDDYIAKDLFGDGYSVTQYALSARHADVHKWYYFPRMTQGEGILFKLMDSDWTKSGRICFHMSANDPSVPSAGSRPRESIELRMLCFWRDAVVDSMPTEERISASLTRSLDNIARSDPTSLGDASVRQIACALLAKVPLVGRLFAVDGGGDAGPRFSGDPEDYVARFKGAIEHIDVWPSFAKEWAKNVMRTNGEAGSIAALTRELVNDSMGYQKTRHYSREDKQKIVEHLLESDGYMASAKKHLVPLINTA